MVESRWPRWISPHGEKIRIRMRVKGKTHTEIFEGNPYKQTDLKAAIRRADEIHSALKLGISIDGEDDAKYTLFINDCQGYLDSHDGAYSTKLDYKYSLEKYWIPAFINKCTQHVTAKMINRVLGGADISNKRKKNIMDPLRGVFNYAEVNPNPASKISVKAKKGDKTPIHRFTPDERQAIMEAIDNHWNGNYQKSAYFALLFGCGLRPSGEPLGLKWTDYKNGYIDVHTTIVRTIVKRSTKTYKDRTVYVPEWVRTYLDRLPTRMKGEWMFINENGERFQDSRTFNRFWIKVFKTAVIKKKLRIAYQIPYTCRHTRAAELLSMGIAPARCAQQLGHSYDMFMNIYSEYIKEYAGIHDDSDLEGVGVKLRGVR